MRSIWRQLFRSRAEQDKPVDQGKAEAEYLYQSALRSRSRGDYEQAVDLFRQVLFLYQKNDVLDSFLLCQVLYHLGTSLRYVGNYDESAVFLAKAVATRVRSQSLLINCYSSLATSLKYRGYYEQAILHYQNAIALHIREKGRASSSSGLALLFVSLASTYCEMGAFPLAEELLDRAFLILECIDPNIEILGFANYHYGILCKDKEDWDQASLKIANAKSIYEGLGNLEMSAICKRELAILLIHKSEKSLDVERHASELLDRAIDDLKSSGRRTVHLAATHIARGKFYFVQEDLKKAMNEFGESETILIERAPFSSELAQTCIAIAEVLQVQGDKIGALGRYQQAMTIFEHQHSETPTMMRTANTIKLLEVEIVAECDEGW